MPFTFSHGQTCCEGVVSPVCAIDFVKLLAHPLDEDLLKKSGLKSIFTIRRPKSVRVPFFQNLLL